jgi:hypothetical protein
MKNVIRLSVIIKNVIMLSVIMQNVIMVSVNSLSVAYFDCYALLFLCLLF